VRLVTCLLHLGTRDTLTCNHSTAQYGKYRLVDWALLAAQYAEWLAHSHCKAS
jgi:hypothetical protein